MCVSDTTAVSSSTMRSNSSGCACTTRAPRDSCACQIWPTVGNSRSDSTIFERPPYRSPLASALTPAETDVVTAISSGSALISRANARRADSVRSTQYSHGAPSSSQSRR